jgi:hypothetical protein
MATDKHNATHQERQQPLSLSQALRSLPTLGDLGLPVRSLSNSRQDDPKQRRDFLLSILEQAIEIAKDMDASFLEEYSADNADGEQEENARS